MKKVGQVCSRSKPCRVCCSWPEALWTKVKQAEIRSAKCRLDQAETHLSGVRHQTGMGQLGTPGVRDKAGVASYIRRDPRIEAPTGGTATFKAASSAGNFQMGKAKAPHGGPGPQYVVLKTGGVSPLNRAPVSTGV